MEIEHISNQVRYEIKNNFNDNTFFTWRYC